MTAKFAVRKPLYKNICYLNSTRQKVTKECCDRFTEGKQSYEVEFIYDSNKEVYPVCAGIPVLATTNLKTEEIYNMMEFKVERIIVLLLEILTFQSISCPIIHFRILLHRLQVSGC